VSDDAPIKLFMDFLVKSVVTYNDWLLYMFDINFFKCDWFFVVEINSSGQWFSN